MGQVQDQGNCASAYAFATVGAVQSAMSIMFNQTVQLYSVQQVVSCSQAYGNDGCDDGFSAYVYDYLS